MINYLKNFTTPEEAFYTMQLVEQNLAKLVRQVEQWQTYKITHDDPEVWRLWRQLGEVRMFIHKIFPCDHPFLHVHPAPSVVKCLKGGYEQTIAISNEPIVHMYQLQPADIDAYSSNLVKQVSLIVPGSIYEMTDIRHFHSVKVKEVNWSLMLMGKPYFPGASKQFSRKEPINCQLNDVERQELYDFACSMYN